MKLPFPSVAALPILLGLLATAAAQQPPPPAPPVSRDDAVRLQIFLDKHNFGPGKIDGRYGGFTKMSWQLYQKAQGQAPTETFDAAAPPISSIDPIYTTYTVTDEDASAIGQVPHELADQEKGHSLPYTSIEELLGERFHSGVKFLEELNAPKKLDHLKIGDTVTVPNVVPPFELDQVLALRQKEENFARWKAQAKVASSAPGAAVPPPQPALPLGMPPPPVDPKLYVLHVSIAQKYLEFYQGDKLVAAFPITPGSTDIPTPKGEWKIESKTLFPEFRWDKLMLSSGKRSDDFHQLPPGPNNPVGICWIALNRTGIGIHGTNDPETIGRAASHGCIRLANWDVFKVFPMVSPGMKVIIE